MSTAIIVAMAADNVIGKDNDLPWRLSSDLKRFKALTTGHAIIMGRKTWESIGRPLPNRRNIIISRNTDYSADGAETFSSLQDALAAVDGDSFIIGGAQIYQLALALGDKLYITDIEATVDGDTQFPEIDFEQWELIANESHPIDEKNEHPYSFKDYQRKLEL